VAMAATVAARTATRRAKRVYKAVAVKVRGVSRAGAHIECVGQVGGDGEALEWSVHGEVVTVALLPTARKKTARGLLQRR
jgi:hypothetical protein